ncbi:hypothetical protein OROMI_004389 [Orobanche minor]
MDILPIEMIEEIVSRTSPLDVCGKLSIVSRSFWSAAKSDITWERFLPADLISRRAVSDQYLFKDPWKKIDFDTMRAFPTKKDLYLFLSDNPLIIDDGVMYFWLDKFSGNKCFHISPKLILNHQGIFDSEPSRFNDIPILEGKENLEISGKISTSLLSSNAAYTAYLLFTFEDEFGGFGEEEPLETFVGIDGGGCETENRIVYIPFLLSLFYHYKRAEYPKLRSQYPEFTGPQYPVRRADGWYEVELGDYFNKKGSDSRELKMSLREVKSGREKFGISLQGIEIRAMKKEKNSITRCSKL